MKLILSPNADLKPTMPPCPVEGYVGSAVLLDLVGIPAEIGNCTVSGVRVSAASPDNSITTAICVKEADGTWSCKLPATATSGRVAHGVQVLVDGTLRDGSAIEGYCLAITDMVVYARDLTIDAGGTSWYMHLFDSAPNPPRKGDVAPVDGILKYCDGTAWQAFGSDANALVAKSALAPLSGQVLPEVATQREVKNMVRLILNTLQAAAVAVAVAFMLPALAVTPTTEWQDVPPTNIVADVVGEFAPTKADAVLEFVTPPVPAHNPLVFTPSDEGDIFAGSVSTNAGALKLGTQEDKLLAPFGEYVRADVDPLKIGLAADAGGTGSAAIGVEASAASTNTIAVGTKAYANGTGAIAIGAGARASANGAVQIGYSTTTNTTANSLRFRDTIIVANGKIPNSALAGSFVPTSRKVNGQTLAADVTITAASIGAATTADATLTKRGPNHDGFTAWSFSDGNSYTIKVFYEEMPDPATPWKVGVQGAYGNALYATEEAANYALANTLTEISFYTDHTVSATRTALPGCVLGSQTDKPVASEAEVEALRTTVAGKQDALTSQQLANIADVPNKANASDLRYSLVAPTITSGQSGWSANPSQVYDYQSPGTLVDVAQPEWTTEYDSTSDENKTGWFWHNPDYVWELLSEEQDATALTSEWMGLDSGGDRVDYTIHFTKTTSPATATITDRATNAFSPTSAALSLALPAAQAGRSRDFYIVATPTVAATITVAGATLVDASGNAVTLAAPASKTTCWHLTEIKEATTSPSANPVFRVEGANVEQAIASKASAGALNNVAKLPAQFTDEDMRNKINEIIDAFTFTPSNNGDDE